MWIMNRTCRWDCHWPDHHAFTAGLNHEVSEQSALGLQYGFYRYTDKFLNGAADYRAHGLFATWTLRFGDQ